LIEKLNIHNEIIALFIVDQRMPQMTGAEFLQLTMNVFPEARRVLLTAYGDKDAIMMSINKVKIDYYLMKPWDPPEEHLYPALNDLLDDWWASFRPPFEGVKVIGQGSHQGHMI
jgi:thioredoxin reductase (NADPH)